ncbi:MAG: phosphate signaling complex protein PhoU [Brachybacterium sp.]|nr:phosphate signaling complex protein PhoU [Brachybacterium sp.]
MREAFQSDLQELGEDLVEMCDLVQSAVVDANAALLNGDLGLAERVIAADAHIDEFQLQIDERAVDMLARQSPVATDLRILVAALRMSSSLERMGDLAEHVALVVRRRHPEQVFPEELRGTFESMGRLVVEAIEAAGKVIEDRDLALAAQVEKNDAEIDELMMEVSRGVGRHDSGFTPAQIVDLTLLARFYERIGDHAVSLVRRIGFLVTGGSIDPRTAATDVEEI